MTLPAHTDSVQAERDPAALARWLQGLDYSDLAASCRRLEGALRACNSRPLPAGERGALLRLYAQRHLQLRDAFVAPDRQQPPRSLDTTRQHCLRLLGLVAEIAAGARLAVNEALAGTPPRADAHLGALQLNAQFVGEAMMLHYAAYLELPSYLWRELNGLFRHTCPERRRSAADELGHRILREACLRAVLTALADPHRLPFGQVWDVYELLREWAPEVEVLPLAPRDNPAGHFVVDLKSAAAPTPLARFDQGEAPAGQFRLLDCRTLQSLITRHLACDRAASELPGGFSGQHLGLHLAQAWTLPARRAHAREARSGLLSVTLGFEPCHQNLGGETFQARFGAEGVTGIDARTPAWAPEHWNFLNESPGGVAVCSGTRPRSAVQVGELALLEDPAGEETTGQTLAVVRWVMVQKNHTHLMGLQRLSRAARAAELHRLTGAITPPTRALLLGTGGRGGPCELLLAPGRAGAGSRYLLRAAGIDRTLELTRLRDATPCFEHFEARWLV